MMALLRRLFGRQSAPVSPVVPRPTPAPSKRPVVTKSRLAGAAGAGLLATTIAFVGGWEGLETRSYRDIVGVWTACYGETRDIGPNMTFTKAECDTMFARRLVEFEGEMRRCLTNPDRIPDGAYTAFLSLAYNVGSSAFCGSTLVRHANAGDLISACNQLPRWNKAGGKVVRGLTNRRAAEQKMCLESVR